jgi:hypothetical protein
MLASLGEKLQNLVKPGQHSADEDNNEHNHRHRLGGSLTNCEADSICCQWNYMVRRVVVLSDIAIYQQGTPTLVALEAGTPCRKGSSSLASCSGKSSNNGFSHPG